MLDRRWRPFVYGAGCVLAVWLLAWGGYRLAQHYRVTAEKVRAELRRVDLGRLSPAERARALRDLARRLNALSYEERRMARLDREWARWFAAMTEAEKSAFMEATLPTGIKQMLGAFEELPEARRRKTIDDALRRLREARVEMASADPQTEADFGANAPPVISEELRRQATTAGLRTFYSQSSAQTKAELAPLLEELQRAMEHGLPLRGR